MMKFCLDSANVSRPLQLEFTRRDESLMIVCFYYIINGLETKISRTFLDFLHLGHEFFVISGHGT